jgi:hypothetical protein
MSVEQMRCVFPGDVVLPEPIIGAVLELDERVRKLEATRRPELVFVVMEGEYEEREINSVWYNLQCAEARAIQLNSLLPKERVERGVGLARVYAWGIEDAAE